MGALHIKVDNLKDIKAKDTIFNTRRLSYDIVRMVDRDIQQFAVDNGTGGLAYYNFNGFPVGVYGDCPEYFHNFNEYFAFLNNNAQEINDRQLVHVRSRHD